MRLDKFLSDTGTAKRSEAKGDIKKGFVTVNGAVIKNPGYAVNENADSVVYKGSPVLYRKYLYYVLNKPAGYVCSASETDGESVLKLLPKELQNRVNPVGRLDKNTTGILLFTDDGELAHRLISPKSHVEKTYRVVCEKTVTDEDKRRLREGVNLGDGEESMPAGIEDGADEYEIYLTISEGKYHQVKRMLKATCNKVEELQRISFGGLSIETLGLKEGDGRLLTDDEIKEIRA